MPVNMPKHKIKINETKIGTAVMEMLEDRIADVAMHYEDPTVDAKASTITLKVTITPGMRGEYGFSVSGQAAMSGHKSFESRMYMGVDKDSNMVEVFEDDPRQVKLEFDKAK